MWRCGASVPMAAHAPFLLVVLVLAGIVVDARPAVRRFATRRGAEEVETLVVPRSPPYTFQRVYRLDVPDVAVGDVVDVTAQFEVTNNLGFNVMLAHFLSVNGTHDADMIAPAFAAGENVSPAMHHGYRSVKGSFEMTEDLHRRLNGSSTVPVSLYAYAASDASNGHQTIIVERGYGGLTAIAFAGSNTTV